MQQGKFSIHWLKTIGSKQTLSQAQHERWQGVLIFIRLPQTAAERPWCEWSKACERRELASTCIALLDPPATPHASSCSCDMQALLNTHCESLPMQLQVVEKACACHVSRITRLAYSRPSYSIDSCTDSCLTCVWPVFEHSWHSHQHSSAQPPSTATTACGTRLLYTNSMAQQQLPVVNFLQ
jgi:hypothetical protein